MRECPQCWSTVFDESEAICPICGFALAPSRPPEKVLPDHEDEAGITLSEESLLFRKQFEERSVHLPQEVLAHAEAILSSAQSELREATILLVDLCGFSRGSRHDRAEDLSRLASEFYRVCTDFILRRGGFVVKFLGDAVLSVFGAPVAFDRDVESAVLAALDILEYAEQSASSDTPMAFSIGVATGVVKSGRIEGPGGKTYDVLGDAVNLAARLQAAAGKNVILVCETTQSIIHPWFRTEPTSPLSLRNISESYVAHNVLGRKDAPSHKRPSDTPFCGREEELDMLGTFLAHPKERGVQIAHVTGEAGIGKSRLIQEALHRAQNGRRVVEWESSPAYRTILLWPILEWLRREMGLAPDDSGDKVRRAIRAYLAARVPDGASDLVLLEYVFGGPEAIAILQGIPPDRIQRNLFSLLRLLLLSRGNEGKTVLVVDDCQWLDSLSMRFLQSLAQWPDSQSLTIVLVRRSGSSSPISEAPEHLQIHLKPLSETDRMALLKSLVPMEEFLPEIRALVLSKASGNPLFVEELTRIVVETMRNNAHLNGEELKNHIVEVIPVSLRDLIQSRIDRLGARTRQVLQCASLLGLEFAFGLLDMFEIIHEGLAGHLEALRGMRYLAKRPDLRDINYYFTHGLYRDVAYSTLLEEQKRNLHGSLARHLEKALADRLPENYEILAFHFSLGGDTQKAIYYQCKAADRKVSLGVTDEGVSHYTQVINSLRSLDPTPERQILMAKILIRCGRALRTLGKAEESDEMLAGALQCAESAGNERLAIEAKIEQAVGQVWSGRLEEAREALEKLEKEASRLGANVTRALALNSLGVAEWQQGRHEAALRAFQGLADVAEAANLPQMEADAFNNAGLIYWRWNQFPQALKAFHRALALRRKASDQFGLCATLMNIGIVQEQMGKLGAARLSYQNALSLAERTGYAQGLAATESNISNIERRSGTAVSALEHALKALEFARLAEDPYLLSVSEENAGLALALAGRAEEARPHLDQALVFARKLNHPEREASARLSVLETGLDRLTSNLTGNGSPLKEINDLFRIIDDGRFPRLKPRACRLKARMLDILGADNTLTVRQYLELARDLAREANDFFEELDSWRALKDFARHRQDAELLAASTEQLGRMEQILLS